MRFALVYLLVASAAGLLAACETAAPSGDPDAHVVPGADAGGDPDAATPADAFVPPMECAASDVRCVDTQIAELRLFDTAAPAGLVTEEGATPGETTYIDATAMPSMGTSPTTSYVYARFTDAGLEQVAVSDEDAFLSTDWDIAFRRFVIRLNSGSSGPSCVHGARVPPAGGVEPSFESITEVPAGLELFPEAYYTEAGATCTLVNDGSGLPGAPDTVLAGYWRYSDVMCLSMTDAVYVIALRDGRHVKLTVLSYYSPANQERCDSGMSTESPSGSASIRVRWAFLD